MKHIDEYRSPEEVQKYVKALRRITTRPWTIMEICGGQTHAILRFGLDELLPSEIELVHGPGCPVCVTPLESVDKAVEIASRPGVTFCTFGDMIRVPGSHASLADVKADGGDVRIVYSPLDAVRIATQYPDRHVVFFAVGFETTAPANALAVREAYRAALTNFSVLVSHVLVPPAMEAILSAPQHRVQAFLAAGHVCTIMGTREYHPLAARYHVPIVVTGFEPLDILQGVYMVVKQLEEGRAEVENQYARNVRTSGNSEAQQLMSEVFQVISRKWRGVGNIPFSGLGLREPYTRLDAEQRFAVTDIFAEESSECIAGVILQGIKKPPECAAFGTRCTPETPLGATMVSAEGACASYYRYRRRRAPLTSTEAL